MFVFRKRTNSGPLLSGPFLYVYWVVLSDIKVSSSVSRFVLSFNFVHIVRIQVVQDYAGAYEVSPKFYEMNQTPLKCMSF